MLEWSVPALLSQLPGVLDSMREILVSHQVSEKVIEAIESSVREAFESVVLGARTSSELGQITVGLWIVGRHHEAFVRLAYQGSRRDPTLLDSQGATGAAGAGIYLLRRNMDQVKYEYVHGMNVLTLRKCLTA